MFYGQGIAKKSNLVAIHDRGDSMGSIFRDESIIVDQNDRRVTWFFQQTFFSSLPERE